MGQNGHSAPYLAIFEALEREIYDNSRKNNPKLLRPRTDLLISGRARSTKNVDRYQGK